MNRNQIATIGAFFAVFLVFGAVAWIFMQPTKPNTSPPVTAPADTAVIAAADTAVEATEPRDTAAPLSPQDTGPVAQKERPKRSTHDTDADDEIVVEGRPEDGGRAFGHAVCVKKKDCGCATLGPRECLRTWQFIKQEDYATARCLLDMNCEAICNYESAPEAQACRTKLKELTSARFGARTKGFTP